jgi:hypothetical protein
MTFSLTKKLSTITLNAYAECHYAECLLCEVSQLSPLFRVSFAECQYDECLDAAETNQKCRKMS